MCRALPLKELSETWRGRFHPIKVSTSISVDCVSAEYLWRRRWFSILKQILQTSLQSLLDKPWSWGTVMAYYCMQTMSSTTHHCDLCRVDHNCYERNAKSEHTTPMIISLIWITWNTTNELCVSNFRIQNLQNHFLIILNTFFLVKVWFDMGLSRPNTIW